MWAPLPRDLLGTTVDLLTSHPELQTEQAYIDHAYRCLEEARQSATRLESMVEVGRGGTEQARFERDVIWDTVAHRLKELELGDASLVFGRIDTEPTGGDGGEAGDAFYIGRVAVSDEHRDPVVIDWRAPVAEPFYRATGRQPMGLARRRHFATRGRMVLGIEDELFGAAAAAMLGARAAAEVAAQAEAHAAGNGNARITGHGALIAALETTRTGRLTDIVATIQGEQDEIIRSELPGILVVQGGPGTGKTVVALHRAAYLLYTHRFPLEGQGVLVVGPNRLFLGYIEQVLPSLGEAGVELAVLADLLTDAPAIRGVDRPGPARIKGDLRMADVLAKAVRDRRRPLKTDLEVGYGVEVLRVRAGRTQQIVNDARRRARTHNAGRKFVEAGLFEALAASSRYEPEVADVRDRLRHDPAVREALERMWPVLTPAQLLHDLFGSKPLLRLAAGDRLSPEEVAALHRPRSQTLADAVFTADDVPLLDEARWLLGARPRRRSANGASASDDDVRTYGHIIVDEAQDLSPMQLRMLGRRSLNGSMTIVGDIAQATGAWAHGDWSEILEHLPTERRAPRRTELTIGYRIPAPNMALAAKVLAVAAPDLKPPRSVREDGDPPRVVRAASSEHLAKAAAAATIVERDAVGTGNVAVIVPTSQVDDVAKALEDAGLDFGIAPRSGLDLQVTIVPVGMVKGLEVDASVVVEPAGIVAEEAQGHRALYVALTRSTKRLCIVHAEPLPDTLR
jgi:DNA helicase IV